MVSFFKMATDDFYDVSSLVLSQIVTRPAAEQLHNNNTEFVWWVGGWLPTNYQVHSQLMLRLSWAVTTSGFPQRLWSTRGIGMQNDIGVFKNWQFQT